MIAHIHHQYISTCDPKWIANLLVTLAENNHMVDCDPETQELMEQCVAKHSGTSDRVSENAGYLPTPKKLYRFFCGMNSKTDDVDRAYIDTLKQPLYHWHMWRKRAIENYFPPEVFEKINLNVDRYRNYSIPERYFIRVENEIEGYDKKNLVHVAESMSRNDYEAISDKLIIEGEEMSEIRLFLLKMAKVV